MTSGVGTGRPYYAEAAYRSAVAHPYHVSAYRDWSSAAPVTVGFQTEAEARAFAASRPEPIIDLVERDRGVIGTRRAGPLCVDCGALATVWHDRTVPRCYQCSAWAVGVLRSEPVIAHDDFPQAAE